MPFENCSYLLVDRAVGRFALSSVSFLFRCELCIFGFGGDLFGISAFSELEPTKPLPRPINTHGLCVIAHLRLAFFLFRLMAKRWRFNKSDFRLVNDCDRIVWKEKKRVRAKWQRRQEHGGGEWPSSWSNRVSQNEFFALFNLWHYLDRWTIYLIK